MLEHPVKQLLNDGHDLHTYLGHDSLERLLHVAHGIAQGDACRHGVLRHDDAELVCAIHQTAELVPRLAENRRQLVGEGVAEQLRRRLRAFRLRPERHDLLHGCLHVEVGAFELLCRRLHGGHLHAALFCRIAELLEVVRADPHAQRPLVDLVRRLRRIVRHADHSRACADSRRAYGKRGLPDSFARVLERGAEPLRLFVRFGEAFVSLVSVHEDTAHQLEYIHQTSLRPCSFSSSAMI